MITRGVAFFTKDLQGVQFGYFPLKMNLENYLDIILMDLTE